MLRNRMLRVCARVQSTEIEGGTPRVTRSVLMMYRTLTWREMAGLQEVGRGLNNYVHSVLPSHCFTLGWFGGIKKHSVIWLR